MVTLTWVPAAIFGDDVEFTDAISREFNVFNHLTPTDQTDAVDREFTVFNDLTSPVELTDAATREFTVFNDLVNPVEVTDSVSREFSVFPVIPIELGVPYQGALATGQQYYLKVEVPADLTVRISLDHANPAAWTELYARFGAPPTIDQADFVFEAPASPDQKVIIPTTQAGTYYILIRCTNGATPPASTDAMVLAESLPFGVQEVSPAVIGAGQATLQFQGAEFTDSTVFGLRDRSTGQQYVPVSTEIVDMATAMVEFNMAGAPLGHYDVTASVAGGPEHILESGLEVAPPTDIRFLQLTPACPAQLRGGKVGQGSFHVTNIGNIDIPVVEFTLLTPDDPHARLWLPGFGNVEAEAGGWPNKSLTLLLPSLRPGETRCIRANMLADTSFPAHGQLKLGAFVRSYSMDAFRDGPLFQQSERVRLAVLADPDTPQDVRAFAEDAETWWRMVSTYFDEFGFDQPRARLGNGAPWYVDAVACLWACHFIGLAAAATFPPAAPVIGLVACPILCAGCTQVDWCDVALNCMIYAGVPGGVLGIHVCMEVIHSWDPNEKEGTGGWGAPLFVRGPSRLPYQIDFENLPAATASAAEVRITDALDPDLDVSTFRLGEIHFGNTSIAVPDGRLAYQTTVDLSPTHGVLVEIEAGLDLEKREAFWAFRSLDPATRLIPEDASLGFLPPNDETGRGQGWVDYTIQPNADAPTGTVIRNHATIVFDFNDPIDTNEVFNTIDAGAPSSAVQPLPPLTYDPNIAIEWAGEDDVGGSGVGTYSLYVSTDGGPYTAFLSNTADLAGVFAGQHGHEYAFYSTAADNVGNVEAAHATPDAVTFVPAPGDFDGDGDVDVGDFGLFLACSSGPEVRYQSAVLPGCSLPPNTAGKLPPDFDADGDTDQQDFAVFQRCWSGSDVPADPDCAD